MREELGVGGGARRTGTGKQGCGESWTRLGGGGALGVPERCIKTAGTSSDSPGRQTACSQLTAHSSQLTQLFLLNKCYLGQAVKSTLVCNIIG